MKSKSLLRGPYGMYAIQYGDSLWSIGERYDVPGGYQTLARINGIPHPDYIFMGDWLKVPLTATAKEELPLWPEPAGFRGALEPCSTKRYGRPMPQALNGCNRSACVQMEGGVLVCSCEGPSPESGSFRVLRGQQMLTSWPAVVAGPDQFEVLAVELDGDHAAEVVVANRYEANDLNMSWWDLAIIDSNQEFPLRLSVDNYGEGTFVRGEDHCDILGTEWVRGYDEDISTAGWYLMGRRLKYAAGALTFDKSHPLLGRRLFYSFQPGYVDVGGFIVSTPARDLSDPRTEVHQREFMTQWRELETLSGTVVGVTPAQSSSPSLYNAVFDINSKRDSVVLAFNDEPDWGGPYVGAYRNGYRRIGDYETQLLYPPGYMPAEPTAWTKSTARVTSYEAFWWQQWSVVWL
jgi:hypothetical protein